MSAFHKIVIDQGADFKLEVKWKGSNGVPINLTGYTGAAQVRESYASKKVAMDFIVTLGGEAGTVVLKATALITGALKLKNNSGVYDLKLVDGAGDVKRLLRGTVELVPEVTP
jgi:hypothetical protein